MDSNSPNSYSKNKANFLVPEGEVGSYYLDPRCDYQGKLLGSGTFNVYAAGARNTLSGDWSGFTGTIIPQLKKRSTYDPVFTFNNSYGMPKATMQLDIEITNSGKQFTIGKVLGTGTLSGNGKYILMSDDDYTFAAKTSASTPLVKKGKGNMTVSKLGNLKGSLEINEGTLRFNNAAVSTLLTEGAVSVTGTGRIVARGLVNELNMQDNAQLSPVNYLSTSVAGKFKVNNACNINGEASVNFLVASATSYSQLLVGSTLNYNGVVNVKLGANYVPAVGDSFTLWTAGTFVGTPTLNLPELPAGLVWDTSELFGATGVLKIASTTGISHISSGTVCQAQVYTTAGHYVTSLDSVVKGQVASALKELGYQAGVYIVRLRGDEKNETIKVAIK